MAPSSKGRTTKAPTWFRKLVASGLLRIAILPISAVCSVLTARITIDSTGIQMYGYINTIAMLFLLIPFADLGVGPSVSTAVARRALSETDARQMYRTILSAVRVLLGVFALLTPVILIVSYSDLLGQLLDLPNTLISSTRTPIFIAFLCFLVSLPLGVGYRMLIGSGNNTVLAAGSAITPIVTVSYTAIAAHAKADPLFFTIGPSLGIMTTNLFAVIIASRILRLSFKKLVMDIPRPIYVPGVKVMDTAWPMIVIYATFALLLHSHRTFLAIFSDPLDLATYALAVQIFLPAWSVIHMAGSVLWSEFAVSPDKKRTWKQANGTLLVISLCGGTALYALGPHLILFMSPGHSQPPHAILLAFSCLMVVMGFDLTQTMLLVSARQLRRRAVWALLALGIYFVMLPSAADRFGSVGIIYLTDIVVFVLQTVPNVVFSHYSLECNSMPITIAERDANGSPKR